MGTAAHEPRAPEKQRRLLGTRVHPCHGQCSLVLCTALHSGRAAPVAPAKYTCKDGICLDCLAHPRTGFLSDNQLLTSSSLDSMPDPLPSGQPRGRRRASTAFPPAPAEDTGWSPVTPEAT